MFPKTSDNPENPKSTGPTGSSAGVTARDIEAKKVRVGALTMDPHIVVRDIKPGSSATLAALDMRASGPVLDTFSNVMSGTVSLTVTSMASLSSAPAPTAVHTTTAIGTTTSPAVSVGGSIHAPVTIYHVSADQPREEKTLEREKRISAAVSLKLKQLQQRALKDKDIDAELAAYIPVSGAYRTYDKETFDLEARLKKFLVDKERAVFLLLGRAGSGKSTFNRYLERCLWKARTEEKPIREGDVIPLFISLPNLDNPETDLMNEYLIRKEFVPEEVAWLRQHYRFVLILDGYDEMNKQINLYRSNQLDTWPAQVIIACRTDYLEKFTNYTQFFMPYREGKAQGQLFLELTVAPFSDSQISAYIRKYLEIHQETHWREAKVYEDHIEKLPGLRALIATPFLLMIAMEVMPTIVEKYVHREEKERVPVTQAELYDEFIQAHFLRQLDKLVNKWPEDGHDVVPDFWAYSKRLGVAMHEAKVTQIACKPGGFGALIVEPRSCTVFFAPTEKVYDKAFKEADRVFKEAFGGEAPPFSDWQRAHVACPVRKLENNRYGFIHPSLVDYFSTKAIYDMDLGVSAVPVPGEASLPTASATLPSGLSSTYAGSSSVVSLSSASSSYTSPSPSSLVPSVVTELKPGEGKEEKRTSTSSPSATVLEDEKLASQLQAEEYARTGLPRPALATSSSSSSAKQFLDTVGSTSSSLKSHLPTRAKQGIFNDRTPASARHKLEEVFSRAGLRIEPAYSEGDCFYDSVAQGINALIKQGIFPAAKFQDIKSLRALCSDYALKEIEQGGKENWIKGWLSADAYSKYRAAVRYTQVELDGIKAENGTRLGDGIAIWGLPEVDGRMLCEKWGIRLHVMKLNEREEVIHQLVDAKGIDTISEDKIDYRDPKILHLISHHEHFVPALPRGAVSSSSHSTSFSSMGLVASSAPQGISVGASLATLVTQQHAVFTAPGPLSTKPVVLEAKIEVPKLGSEPGLTSTPTQSAPAKTLAPS